MTAPKGLTSASGIDVMTHAIEAYVSIMATDYTDGLAMKAVKMVFDNLPSAYENGANDPKAREEMHNASCMAGMAFANAFLGVNHSMAHKPVSYTHLDVYKRQFLYCCKIDSICGAAVLFLYDKYKCKIIKV